METHSSSRRLLSGYAGPLLTLLLCLAALCYPNSARPAGKPASPVVLTNHASEYPLGRHLSILEDPSAALRYEQASAEEHGFAYQPSVVDTPNYGLSDSAYWLKVRIRNDTTDSERWFLECNDIRLQHIEVFIRQGNGRLTEYQGGGLTAWKDRPLRTRSHVFPVSIAHGETVEIHLRVASRFSVIAPLTLYHPERFAEKTRDEYFAYALYFGVLLAMLLYNGFLCATLRDINYLFYLVFLVGSLTGFAALSGVLDQYALPSSPDLVNVLFVQSYGWMILAACAFTIGFLGIRREHGRYWHTGIGIGVMAGAVVLLTLAGLLREALILTVVTVALAIVYFIASGVRAVRDGNPVGIYYLLAWGVLCTGAAFMALTVFGLIPKNFLTFHAAQIGSALEMILLSLALSARVRVLKEEKEKAQREALENQRIAMANKEEALANLQKMDRMKDDFLANTSHELRTPLNGIIGLAEAVLHTPGNSLAIDQRHHLEMIINSGRRLGSLVNDILDFSRMRHRDIVLSQKPLSFAVAVDVVLSLNQPMVRGKPLRLVNCVSTSLPAVFADENRLQQILHNLVGNAVKFTREGSITVDATVKDGMLEASITDTGIGIPHDKLESIFESFNQGDGSTAREFGGTGLGLSITRSIVELHGGRLSVSSTTGEGSCFRFTLPITEAKTLPVEAPALCRMDDNPSPDNLPVTLYESAMPSSPTEPPPVSNRVLVVDDEPINRQVLRAQLQSAGFGVTEAEDGLKALAILDRESTFDLVLLDVMMPQLSGYDTCRQLREQWAAHLLPVIFLTAKSQTADVLAGFEAGGNDYLVKPFSRDELLARLRLHLELRTTYRIISDYSKNLEKRVEDRTRDLVNAQQQLVLRQKMSALGVLTAGVAHEINNPNNFVSAGLQNVQAWKSSFEAFIDDLLSDESDPEIRAMFSERLGKLEEQIAVISSGSQRIQTIVSGLRTITRLDEADQKHVDIIEGLEKTIVLLSPSWTGRVRFIQTFDARPTVLCWAAELNQLFMNVLLNACHATSEKHAPLGKEGSIRLSSRTVANPEGAEWLQIVIEDDGIGMEQAVLERAFDPFFTTRAVGSGAGLGLSIARDIIEKHGGRLGLESVSGQFTRAIIELPC